MSCNKWIELKIIREKQDEAAIMCGWSDKQSCLTLQDKMDEQVLSKSSEIICYKM